MWHLFLNPNFSSKKVAKATTNDDSKTSCHLLKTNTSIIESNDRYN
jgi:hypothetical protein